MRSVVFGQMHGGLSHDHDGRKFMRRAACCRSRTSVINFSVPAMAVLLVEQDAGRRCLLQNAPMCWSTDEIVSEGTAGELAHDDVIRRAYLGLQLQYDQRYD
jgi:hypothetical protein